MIVRLGLGVIAVAWCGLVIAGPKVDPSSPVTHSEVNATLAKVEKALGTLPGMSIKPRQRSPGTQPAKRSYIILELNRIFESARPNFKFTPAKVKVNRAVLSANTKDGSMQALQRLIAWGCVGKVSALATGPKATIGLKDFGDAVGLFAARIAELTHSPDPKFSPGMMTGGGG
jgi:hypothetical protein